jgi:hypothetical protein
MRTTLAVNSDLVPTAWRAGIAGPGLTEVAKRSGLVAPVGRRSTWLVDIDRRSASARIRAAGWTAGSTPPRTRIPWTRLPWWFGSSSMSPTASIAPGALMAEGTSADRRPRVTRRNGRLLVTARPPSGRRR